MLTYSTVVESLSNNNDPRKLALSFAVGVPTISPLKPLPDKSCNTPVAFQNTKFKKVSLIFSPLRLLYQLKTTSAQDAPPPLFSPV